jgi:hypothetical protein
MSLVHQVLFVAWQNPSTRRIFPVARLLRRSTEPKWEFVYIEGARTALEHGFELFHGFRSLEDVTRSEELPPLFGNRLMPKTRSEYPVYLQRLGLDQDAEEIPVLARSEGLRASDPVELFGLPAYDTARQRYRFYFFLRGIRYVEGAEACIAGLRAEHLLDLRPEPRNPVDGLAICVHGRPSEAKIGWVPATLVEDLHELRQRGSELSVTVQQINPHPGPVQTRVLCRLEASFVEGFVPLATERYRPIAAEATSIHVEPAALAV